MSLLLVVYSVVFLLGAFYCIQRIDDWIKEEILSQHDLADDKNQDVTEGTILILGNTPLSEELVEVCSQKKYPFCNIVELSEMSAKRHCQIFIALATDEENLVALSLYKAADYPVYTIGLCSNPRLLWLYRQVGTSCILEDENGTGDAQLLRMVQNQVDSLF